MPQITVKGLTEAQMKKLSTPLMRDLAEAIGCPEDWLIFELAESRFYAGGEQVPGFPIVEVAWFDRPDELERAGYYSILDSMEAIKKSSAAQQAVERVMARAAGSFGDVSEGITMPASMQAMIDRMPLNKLLRQLGKSITPEMVQKLNAALNQIPKTE